MLCPLCGDTRSSPTLVDERRNVYLCSACTHQCTVFSSDSQETYDEHYFFVTHRNWFENPDLHFFSRVLRTFDGIGTKQASILDIGCGNGDLLHYLHKQRPEWDLTGIDLISNDHPRIHFIKGDIYTTSFGKTFDGVACLHTIEHVVDPSELVRIFSSVVAPGGYLLVATIDSSSLIHRIAGALRHIGIRVAYDRIFSSHHLHHFSFQSLRSLLERHDFEVVEHYNYNHPLKSVDVPAKGAIGRFFYLCIVGILFFILSLQGKGMLQCIVCKKRVTNPV